MVECDFCKNNQENCYTELIPDLTLCKNCLAKVTRFIHRNKTFIKQIVLYPRKQYAYTPVIE